MILNCGLQYGRTRAKHTQALYFENDNRERIIILNSWKTSNIWKYYFMIIAKELKNREPNLEAKKREKQPGNLELVGILKNNTITKKMHNLKKKVLFKVT